MPLWALNLLGFFGKRSLHFIVYAIIGFCLWGLYQKIFVTPTSSTTIAEGGRQVNIYSDDTKNKVPIFGCAAWRVQNETYWKKPINHINLKK